MRLLYFGNQEVGCRCLEAIVQEGVCPLLVAALDDSQDPHRRELGYRSVKDVALGLHLPVVSYASIRDGAVTALFQSISTDFILLSIAWREIVPPSLLDRIRKGFNIHGGLLPQMRGGHPTQWAIIEGLSESGVTLHEMEPKVDAGGIIAIERFPIALTDTSVEVRRKHDDAFVSLCRRYIHKLLALDYHATPQDESMARYFPPRTPEDGRVDLSWSFDRIERLTRALCKPYPPAFIERNGELIPVRKVARRHDRINERCFPCADGYFEIVGEE